MSKKPREFWIYHNPEYDRGFPITVVSNEQQAMAPGTEEYHVIEKSAYDELEKDLIKTKKALRDTANGRPSEWAYVQLKQDADKLALALEDALHWGDKEAAQRVLEEYRGEK